MVAYGCAASDLCRVVGGICDGTWSCVECDMAVHHQCIEPFNLQTPRESECVDNAHGCVVKDNLSPGGRKRLISLGEDSKEAVICLTCVVSPPARTPLFLVS